MALIDKLEASENSAQAKLKDLAENEGIVQLISMLEKYSDMTHKCFTNDVLFERYRSSAFENFLNRDLGKFTMAEILAAYSDRLLKKGGIRISENQHEEQMQLVIKLFTHLVDKDLFIEVYRNFLAKRLLNDKSESRDQEKTMISYIKMSCGPQFTKKLEGMLSDLSIA